MMRLSRSFSLKASFIVAVAVAATAFFGIMGAQIGNELTDLRSAANDQMEWSTAQIDVELLELFEAAREAQSRDPTRLLELRKRFDIFYSRAMTRGQIDDLAVRQEGHQLAQELDGLRSDLSNLTPIIDGSDDDLLRRTDELTKAVLALRPVARRTTLEALHLFSAQSDSKRRHFSRLLLRTALAASVLVIALILALVCLFRAHRTSERRAAHIQLSNERYARTISASPEPIIVLDEARKIIKFNPAAEHTFGCSRKFALGRQMADFIERNEHDRFKAHLHQRLTGDERGCHSGWTETRAVRADGEVFPAELSLGVAPSPNGALVIAHIRDITARVRTQKELLDARDAALSAARTKSQFLAIMSHEMRTPLNGVVGMLDLLSATRLTAKQKRYIGTAEQSASILQSHIDDVLEITEIEADRLKVRSAPFEVGELLEEVKSINGPAAAARGDRISVLEFPNGEFIGDRHRLRQILLNLVNNAAKFTENGTIEISASEIADSVEQRVLEFNVTDTGIGIASEDTDRIFENFVTLDPSYRRTAPGYGLGLAICRRIARAMGGEIGVVSEPGVGSRFWVRVPVKLADAEKGREQAALAPISASPKADFGLKVLLVEDNETNRFVAREMLNRAGCKVVEACDGSEGIAAAERERFDLILMDLSMPHIDGLEATRRIRQSVRARSRDAMIVGLTAHVLADAQESLRVAGMQDCLLKPLRSKNLHELLERCSLIRSAGDRAAPPSRWTVRPSGPFDDDVLAELASVLEPKIFERRLAAFRHELEEGESRLASVSVTTDVAEIAVFAHRLAGSAAVFGATDLRGSLQSLEAACLASQRERVSPTLETCRHVISKTRMALVGASLEYEI